MPIAVWRLNDDAADSDHIGPRLAERLVDIYTRRGEAILDFDDDAGLRDAATTADRSYLPITASADLAAFAHVAPPISLVSLRWPRPQDHAGIDDLFTACRSLLAREACIIAIVRSAPNAHAFAHHEQVLRAAADTAGLAHILQIVAISAPGHRDQYHYYTTQTDAKKTRNHVADEQTAVHIDLLVFSP
ncbi:hypothetical protein [Cryptosporangium sp. NPDC048952]|uniref:hypothetical protein n=1 Tax=Cryptosporangium sp. NPDC048952 TaxID=3363961 RepID=UPI003716548F